MYLYILEAISNLKLEFQTEESMNHPRDYQNTWFSKNIYIYFLMLLTVLVNKWIL